MKVARVFLFLLLIPVFLSAKKLTVVIDPGHGGKNKGVVYNNLVEKNITLKLSKKLKKFLKKRVDIDVVFTRNTDKNFPIYKRVELIEKLKPDFFISIHFNSEVFLTSNRGFEIYYPYDNLKQEPAKYFPAVHRNNLSFKLGSLFKQKYLLSNLHTTWKLPFNMFVQKKNLLLFAKTTVPGILLEVAYLTSPEDRACIENDKFISDVAWYIYSSILKAKDILN